MKKAVHFAVLLAVLVHILGFSAMGAYNGGSGTLSDPWRIYTVADLQAIASNTSHWSGHFILTSDINATGASLSPIGKVDTQFTGTFNGDNHTITGLSFNGSASNYGLFAYIGPAGKVQNLNIIGGSISGTLSSQNCGLIAGQNYGTIGNCSVSGTITATSRMGGIAGSGYAGSLIADCQSTITINSSSGGSSNTAGGIIGSNLGTVKTCKSSGNINILSNNAGGIAGFNGSGGLLENCLSYANCYAVNTNSGGIVGYNASGSRVSYCISLGLPEVNPGSPSTKYLGGIAGDNFGGTVEYCLWDQTVSMLAVACGRSTGTITSCQPASSTQLKTTAYIDGLSWEFSDVWLFQSGSYPALNNVPDITLNYTQSMAVANNKSILLDVSMTNNSYNSGGSQVEMFVFVGSSPEEIALLSAPSFDFDTQRFAIPSAQSSQNYQLNLSNSPFFQFTAGTYYVMIVANYYHTIAENNYENNAGPIMELTIFDPSAWEPDNTIGQLNPVDFARSDNPLNKTASLSPVDGSNSDIDWAGLTVDDISDISITATNTESGNIVLELYDPTGTNLLVSGSGTGSASISTQLEAINGPGTHYYIKAYETDNKTIVSYTLNATVIKVKPDLSTSFGEPLVKYYRTGDAAPTLSCSVTNNSVVSTDSFTCILISSPTPSFSKPYNQVNQFTISLAPGATRTNSFAIPTPTTTGDTYYAFIADPDNTIEETNEDNNMTAAPLRLHCYADDSYEQYNDNSLATTNELQSGISQTHSLTPASDVDYMYYYLTESAQISITVNCSKTLAVSMLELIDGVETPVAIGNPTVTGNSYTWSKPLSITTTTRKLYLRIEETATNLEVSEYSVNIKTRPNAPDLQVVLKDKYLKKAAGETISVNIQGLNTGTVAASDIVVDLYITPLSETPNWSTATKYGSVNISSISASGNKPDSISLTTPATAGLYYMQARIFTTGEIVERELNNNESLDRILAVDSDYSYNGGEGTATSPWQIATALQLDTISEINDHLDDFFILTADIDLTTLKGDYSSIGKTSVTPFTGVFDGKNHTISNYQFKGTGSITGIFGYTSFSAATEFEYEISNINLTGVSINVSSSTLPAGGLIANNGCWVNNCTVSGAIQASTNAGLLAGKNADGSGITPRISNCTVNGTVATSGENAGGLVGLNEGYITSCRAIDGSSVTAATCAGGLIGKNTNTIVFCYSWSEVDSSSDYSGGFAGANTGIISSCYSTGPVVSVGSHKNGFCSSNTGTIASCFWNTATSGLTDTSSNSGYIGLDAEQFKDKDIFTASGWEFGSDKPWLMLDGLMWPRLRSLFAFSGGSGTETAPYLVSNDIDLMLISELPDNHYKLMSDFNLDGWPLQNSLFGSYQQNKPFTGILDGNGHKLSNINITRADGYAGLFGYISRKTGNETAAGVKNLILDNVTIETSAAGDVAGCLAGYIYDGFIENCAVRNGSVLCSMYAGGLAGFGEYCQISNSCFTGQIDAALFAGGLAGGLRNSTISGCYSAADIIACEHDYGLTAYQRATSITNSYWNADLCPYGNSGTALNSSQMKTGQFWYDNTSIDLIGETKNGSENLWQVSDNYYPWLAIEQPEIMGDLNEDLQVDLTDFALMANLWLQTGNNSSDINKDNKTDIYDLHFLANDWLCKILGR